MKRGKKIALLTAGILIALGAVLGMSAVLLGDINATDVNTVQMAEGITPVKEDFRHISVDTDACNVSLLPAPDGITRVEWWYPDRGMSINVQVEGDTLHISSEYIWTKWYERIQFGFGLEELRILVYLSEEEYGNLTITSASGDLNVPDAFTFESARLTSASGDVTFRGTVEGELSAMSTSGDVTLQGCRPQSLSAATTSGTLSLSGLDVREDMTLETTSGDLGLDNVACRELTANSSSGTIQCQDVLARGPIRMDTASGEIRLTHCDASSLVLSSSSGDISGTLRTEKIYLAHSDSGNVEVPHSTTGGSCEINTSSGDIHFAEFGGITG